MHVSWSSFLWPNLSTFLLESSCPLASTRNSVHHLKGLWICLFSQVSGHSHAKLLERNVNGLVVWSVCLKQHTHSNITWCVSQILLAPGTGVTSHGKRDFADTVKIKDLEVWRHRSVVAHLPEHAQSPGFDSSTTQRRERRKGENIKRGGRKER